jgi:hypothetical protein
VCLIRCCNEEITVPSLPAEGETVTNAYLRSITDEDAAAQLRDPVLWAYMLRDPTGAARSYGHGKTRKECEQRAITHAGECAEEAWPESRMWVSSKWRLLIWSPENLAGQPCSRIQFKSPLAKKKIRKTKTRGLSKPQITVLLLCIDDKLSRYGTGWAFDDGFADPDPGRMYATATINSLWERGLLDANFTDPRLPCSELGEVRKLDGASKFQVWTSALGVKVLQDKGLLTDACKLVYH